MTAFNGSLDKFLELTDERDRLRGELSAIEKQRTELEADLAEQFATLGLQNIKTDSGRTVFQQLQRSITVKAEHRETAIAAARSLGLEELIAIQPTSFGAWAREQLDDEATGNKLPDEFADLVNVHEQVRIKVRKG